MFLNLEISIYRQAAGHFSQKLSDDLSDHGLTTGEAPSEPAAPAFAPCTKMVCRISQALGGLICLASVAKPVDSGVLGGNVVVADSRVGTRRTMRSTIDKRQAFAISAFLRGEEQRFTKLTLSAAKTFIYLFKKNLFCTVGYVNGPPSFSFSLSY